MAFQTTGGNGTAIHNFIWWISGAIGPLFFRTIPGNGQLSQMVTYPFQVALSNFTRTNYYIDTPFTGCFSINILYLEITTFPFFHPSFVFFFEIKFIPAFLELAQ